MSGTAGGIAIGRELKQDSRNHERRNDMTAMTRHRRLDAGMPRFAPTSPGAARTRPSIVKPIALDRANLLRIRNGRGTRIHVASGVLWVTEENSLADHTLRPGDFIDLTHKGTAIVFAHRPSRIVIEVPPGVALPRTVEMVLAEGERGRRIALTVPASIFTSAGAARITTVIASILESIRRMVTTLGSR